ncbi:hypothetical protein K8Z49_01145 [Actinomadura madurae]|uniref:hypothetical protein n=1 Tax=Actinomadura madurae TaxID=1993 RepID=UPI0039994DBC
MLYLRKEHEPYRFSGKAIDGQRLIQDVSDHWGPVIDEIPCDAVTPVLEILETAGAHETEWRRSRSRRVKGDASTLSVLPYSDEHYADLVTKFHRSGATAPRRPRPRPVRASRCRTVTLHFVCRQSLDGGAPTSLALDTHARLSYRLLALEGRYPPDDR